MTRTSYSRESFHPANAIKIADKQSDAVAYVWGAGDRLRAVIFFGKQSKPIGNYRFISATSRERTIVTYFERRRRHHQMKQERTDATHNLQVGHVLRASWGYEQTNVDFFQVTAVISAKTVELRAISSTRGAAHTSMSGTVLPVLDAFAGKPMRKRATRDGVRVSMCQYARIWDGKPVFESSWH